MLKLIIPAGLVAFLVPATFALFVNSGRADSDKTELVVAQANVVTPVPASDSSKVVQPDAMPELGQTPAAPTPKPELPTPEFTPVPVVTPVPALTPVPAPKPAEPEPTAIPTEGKTRKAMSDDVIEETPAAKVSETKSKSSSEIKPKTEPSKSGLEPAGNRVANESNGNTVVVTGRIISVEPDQGNSLRAEVKLNSGELIIVMFPPWGGMRVPSVGGMVTAEAKKLSTSDGQATLRAVKIRSTGAPEGEPPARMVPGIRRGVVPGPVGPVPGPPSPPPPAYF